MQGSTGGCSSRLPTGRVPRKPTSGGAGVARVREGISRELAALCCRRAVISPMCRSEPMAKPPEAF